MMSKTSSLTGMAMLLAISLPAAAATVDDLQTGYRQQGAGEFSAEAGMALWNGTGVEDRRCTSCHGDDLRRDGKHARTGKTIAAMAPSANPERYTDARKVEKWFLRNCKWTLGRQCTPQEKGDVLEYLRNQ